MAAPNLSRVVRIPGRVIVNPTNLALPYPYGGTELGIHRDVELRFNDEFHFPDAEEYANAIEGIYCGGTTELKCTVRGLDVDALRYLFIDSTIGSYGILLEEGVFGAGAVRAGTLMSSIFNIKIMFVPKDTDRHPCVLLYQAIPMIEPDSGIELQLKEEVGIEMRFRSLPDATGRTVAVGKLGALTL
jgi:hypothetical protein